MLHRDLGLTYQDIAGYTHSEIARLLEGLRVDAKINEMIQEMHTAQVGGEDPGGRYLPRQSDLEMLDRVNERLKDRRSPA